MKHTTTTDKRFEPGRQQFTVTSAPHALSEMDLEECNQPQTRPTAGERRYYAVARVDGVINYGPGAFDAHDGCSILYMSQPSPAGGRRVFERHYHVAPGRWDEIDAYCDRRWDDGQPADETAKQFVPVLERHRGA